MSKCWREFFFHFAKKVIDEKLCQTFENALVYDLSFKHSRPFSFRRSGPSILSLAIFPLREGTGALRIRKSNRYFFFIYHSKFSIYELC